MTLRTMNYKMWLYMASRFFFFVFLVGQHGLLLKFVFDHQDNPLFYGLIALLLILLFYWAKTLYSNNLKYKLAHVWFAYSFVFVIMIGMIFGWAVIEDNKLREQEIATCLCNDSCINASTPATKDHSFFDSKLLKMTLCITPGLMLLLLTSVTDETGTLKQLQLVTVMDLFDGIEMIEVLHEDICDKIPMGWEIAVLVAALLFFLLSALEVYQVKFEEPNDAKKSEDMKIRKKTAVATTFFQILINVAFLVIRMVLWLEYEFDSAVFLAKNVISLVMVVHNVMEACIKPKPDKGNSTKKPREKHEMGRINTYSD